MCIYIPTLQMCTFGIWNLSGLSLLLSFTRLATCKQTLGTCKNSWYEEKSLLALVISH